MGAIKKNFQRLVAHDKLKPEARDATLQRNLKMRRSMMASLSGGLASMGAAAPYARDGAIAAQMTFSDTALTSRSRTPSR